MDRARFSAVASSAEACEEKGRLAMPRLKLVVGLIERSYRVEHDRLSTDLAAAGWTVIEPRRGYEQRSLGAAAIVGSLTALVIYLEARIAPSDLERLLDVVTRHLRRPRRANHPPREARIFGPTGELIATVSLDADETHAA